MKKYICTVCDWVYDPEVGDPDAGIAPGTAFEDLPEDWVCPVCGVGKEDFQPVEEYSSKKYAPLVRIKWIRGVRFYITFTFRFL